jgi:hypothetical protein
MGTHNFQGILVQHTKVGRNRSVSHGESREAQFAGREEGKESKSRAKKQEGRPLPLFDLEKLRNLGSVLRQSARATAYRALTEV